MTPLHLLAVWNPSYADDALDAHVRLLLHWANEHRAGRADRHDIYVWWPKLRSPNRIEPLPHHDDVLALERQIENEVYTHLYLTDYRSLYVAWLGEVSAESIPDTDPEEKPHIPAYAHGRHADFWFRLWDIRRIVRDDTPAVIAQLRSLRNTRYHDRPVSLYGGMVDLPLLVKEDPPATWFTGRDALTDDRLWAEVASDQGHESARMEQDLRENLFGDAIWSALELETRSFLASAEAVFRVRRSDPGFDASTVALEYAKCVETELNALVFSTLRGHLKGRKPQDREVRVDGHQIDLGGFVPHQSLGALLTLLRKDDVVRKGLRLKLPNDGGWLTDTLPKKLERLRDLRNRAAHSEVITPSELLPWRRELLGIGEEGLLTHLARIKLRAG